MPIDPNKLEREFERLHHMEAGERRSALRTLAQEDEELASRVAALLDAVEGETLDLDALGRESLDQLAGFDPADLVGTDLGGWRLTEELGRGGMGVVFAAERHEEGVHQRAAIKLLSVPMFDPEASRRFVREAATLARLDHPGICRLRDWGRTPEGWAYLVLDRVEGENFGEAMGRLPIRGRIELMSRVADIVAAAHKRLIVHLDIKPDNVMVGPDGAPVLLDFGVSRVINEDGALATRTFTRWLTPQYASPEQLRGEAASVSADVYSLGALLYEAVTGERPYDLSGVSMTDALDRVERGPVAPSKRARGIGRDLDAVVARAMHPDPARRYDSAGALAEDLRAVLASRPVSARPDGVAYRIGKFFQRNPVAAPLGLLAVAATAVLAVLLAVQSVDLRQQRDLANRQAVRASAATDLLLGAIESADPTGEQGAATTVDQMLEAAERRIDLEAENDPQLAAETLTRIADVRVSLGQPQRAVALYERALEALRRSGSWRGDQRIAVVAGLATALRAAERTGEARELVENEIDRQDEPVPWRLSHALAQVMVADGDLADAEALLRRTLAIVPVSEVNGRALILSNLGNVRSAMGQPEEALTWFQQAADEARKPPVDRELLATVQLNAANTLSRTGRIEEALAAADESLALRIDMYGERHVRTVPSYIIRAYVLMAAGRWDDAIEAAETAAALERDLAGGDSRRLAAIYRAKGLAADRKGDTEAAREGFAAALEVQERLLPDDHYDLAVTRSNLASAMMAQGEYEESLELLMKAWRVHDANSGGEPSRSRAIAEVNIAWCHLRLDEPAEALDWAETALRGAEQVIEPGQWILGHFRNVYAEALLANGRLEEARSEARAVATLYESSDVPVRRKSLEDNLQLLARIADRSGEAERAADYRQRLTELDDAAAGD
ncbi:MAG: tetratricopeptide repeat protein [Gammaproteobacteria bacterium]|jgi:serine/threonine-protein kinase|nr:tetratricopeptide repeat protein [Gammaproteobacteria bacterium]